MLPQCSKRELIESGIQKRNIQPGSVFTSRRELFKDIHQPHKTMGSRARNRHRSSIKPAVRRILSKMLDENEFLSHLAYDPSHVFMLIIHSVSV